MEYRGYKIEGDGTFGLYEIKPLGRGSVPKPLRGKYTNHSQAKVAIDQYESSKDKGRKNVKTTNKGGD